jgi:7-carboxy-7-deazaguanine synthase
VNRYAVKEAFLTLQGEGHFAGSRAVFVRFAGCNVWSGREETRERDLPNGLCAAWCDTKFVGTDGQNGGRYTADELSALVLRLWGKASTWGWPLVVLTGGEPSLQVDDELLEALRPVRVHVETNGSRKLPRGIDWVTLSPKPPMPVVDQPYHEVKVIYPAVDPLAYEGRAPHRFIQPIDSPEVPDAVARAVAFVLARPDWRLSLQTHKLLGIP